MLLSGRGFFCESALAPPSPTDDHTPRLIRGPISSITTSGAWHLPREVAGAERAEALYPGEDEGEQPSRALTPDGIGSASCELSDPDRDAGAADE